MRITEFHPCTHCGREASHAVTIELRPADAGRFEAPEEIRRAYICARCLEVRYAGLFGGFGSMACRR